MPRVHPHPERARYDPTTSREGPRRYRPSGRAGPCAPADPRIVPNGRRDHFEQSVHFHNLLTHLVPVARVRQTPPDRGEQEDRELRGERHEPEQD